MVLMGGKKELIAWNVLKTAELQSCYWSLIPNIECGVSAVGCLNTQCALAVGWMTEIKEEGGETPEVNREL